MDNFGKPFPVDCVLHVNIRTNTTLYSKSICFATEDLTVFNSVWNPSVGMVFGYCLRLSACWLTNVYTVPRHKMPVFFANFVFPLCPSWIRFNHKEHKEFTKDTEENIYLSTCDSLYKVLRYHFSYWNRLSCVYTNRTFSIFDGDTPHVPIFTDFADVFCFFTIC